MAKTIILDCTKTTLLECKTEHYDLFIEHEPGSPLPFRLESGFNRIGLRQVEELPRRYKTLAAAKAGATRILGKLTWVVPANK